MLETLIPLMIYGPSNCVIFTRLSDFHGGRTTRSASASMRKIKYITPGDFEVFCPTAVTCYTNLGQIWHGGGRFHNNQCIGVGVEVWAPKLYF